MYNCNSKVVSLFLILCLSIAFPCLRVWSQGFKKIPIDFEKNFVFAKTAWVMPDKFCIVTERIGNNMAFIFDTTGKLIYKPVKINFYSAQSEYGFILNTTMISLKYKNDEYGYHKFRIQNSMDDKGIVHEHDMEIFTIKETIENEKLNKHAYSFKVYSGISRRKALLTYNNDYKGEIKEGFRYRIINDRIVLSDENIIELPYPDRGCNIEDVVYDDLNNKVYVLCDLFSITNNDERTFIKSFLSVFDLPKKSYEEISVQVPSFYKNKVQHSLINKKLIFAGIKINVNDNSGWRTSLLTFDIDSDKVIFSNESSLNTKEVEKLFEKVNILSEKYFYPEGILQDKDEMITAGWSYFFQYGDAQTDKEMMTQAVGGAIVIAATANMGFRPFNRSLWINYLPETKTVKEDIIISTLKSDLYYQQSITGFSFKGNNQRISNVPLESNKNKSQVCLFKANNYEHKCDTSIYRLTEQLDFNIILPGSHYYQNDKNYFIGLYDKRNEMKKIEAKKENQFVFIEL